MSSADPILENWYQDAESGRSFRVVAVDSESDSIEVQYLNGDVGEFDGASWEDSVFFPIEPPEDWTAPFDDVELDDMGYSDPDKHGLDLQDMTLEDLLEDDER